MAKIDRNGYAKSIMDTEDGECYICGFVGDTARHEIYPNSSRQICKERGMWVAICPRCHEIVHQNNAFAINHLKRPCMERFLKTHTREEFYELIGAYYD